MPSHKSRLIAFIKNLALSAVAIIVALVMAEGILRLLQHDQRRVNHRDFYERDPSLGWKKKAGAKRIIKTSEFTSMETVNSKGLRGKEYTYEKPQGSYRILILGDSFAEGYTVSDQDLFSEHLKTMLNNLNNGIHYEVINAGTVGYATDQELLFFETEGKKYSPDLVLLLFYENDVLENISITEMYSKYKPLFKLVEDQLILQQMPTEDSGPTPKTQDQPKTKSFFKFHLNRSLLFLLAKEQLVRLGILNTEKEVEESDKRYFQILALNDTPELEYAWTLTTRLLQRLKDSVIANNSQLVIFYIPSVYALDEQVWLETSRKFGLESGKWDLMKPEIRLGRICDSLNIPFKSLGESIRSRSAELQHRPSFFYHIGDGHWNKEGHRHVAIALFDFLERANVLLPRRNSLLDELGKYAADAIPAASR